MRSRFQFDARLVGAGILAAAVSLVVLMLTSPPDTTAILVAGSNVPAGVPFADLDLATRQVVDDFGLIPAGTAESLESHVLGASLQAGAPIPRSLLLAPEDSRGADLVGLELESAAAVHGWLTAGDLVDVYSVTEEAELLAESVAVVGVEVESTSLGSGRVRLVVAVVDDVGPRLLAASEAGAVYLIRKGG